MDLPLRIALVDANRNFHAVLRGMLRALGYRRVDCFVEGASALIHCRHTYIDFVFVDLELADCKGIDLIKAFRHEKLANPTMPVVVLTSQTSKRVIESAIGTGADYVLAKPISPKILGERIPALITRSHNYIKKEDGYFGPDPNSFGLAAKVRPLDMLVSKAKDIIKSRTRFRPDELAVGPEIDGHETVFL